MKLFWFTRKATFYDQIHTMALLGYRYNSFHRTQLQVRDYIHQETQPVTVVNQFIAASKRHPYSKLDVACWTLDTASLKSRLPHLVYFNFFGRHREGRFRFFFPLDLAPEYPGLVEALGKPEQIFNGILTASGRSIWVLDHIETPFCLKIDTMQLWNRRFFSERSLFERGVLHSVEYSSDLKTEKNIFNEDSGASFHFSYTDPDGQPKNYTYLIRTLDHNKSELGKRDHLLPVVAILSPEFWENTPLLKTFRLKTTVVDFLRNDLARCLAEMIRNSLDRTFIHFEIHQQNLTVHLRDGHGIKLLYHDLQDTVLDPVSFFLNRVLMNGTEDAEKAYLDLYELQKTVTLNSHGHLRVNPLTKENFSVVSLYRRYLRNFGHFTQTYNFFSDADYIGGREFEKAVLKYLNFTPYDIMFNRTRERASPFLLEDLFWNIDRYHTAKQKRNLEHVFRNFSEQGLLCENITASELSGIIQQGITICSNGFPVYLRDLDMSQLQDIQTFYNRRVFFAKYRGQTVLLLFFQYI